MRLCVSLGRCFGFGVRQKRVDIVVELRIVEQREGRRVVQIVVALTQALLVHIDVIVPKE